MLGAVEKGVMEREDEVNKREDALPATPDSLAGMMGRKLGVDQVPVSNNVLCIERHLLMTCASLCVTA